MADARRCGGREWVTDPLSGPNVKAVGTVRFRFRKDDCRGPYAGAQRRLTGRLPVIRIDATQRTAVLSLVIPKGSLEKQVLDLFSSADLAVVRGSDRDYHAKIN